MPVPKERNIISDRLVKEKTMKTLEEWFMLLDKKGARKKNHKEIFNLVANIEGLKLLGEWNQNLLTTTYEWNRGLKERGEKKDGFEIGLSKTIGVNIKKLYQAWHNPKLVPKWLGDHTLSIRTTIKNKSFRINWNEGTRLSVELYEKGEDKSMIVVQHLKITTAGQAAELKMFWAEKLTSLKKFLEKDD